jgi:hypothetical protein
LSGRRHGDALRARATVGQGPELHLSGRSIVFELESDLGYSVRPPAEKPVLFIPMIDLSSLDAPCIVDDF